MKDANHVKKAYARVEIEKNIEILAPAAPKREEIMRSVMDSARNIVAARKKGDKIASATNHKKWTKVDIRHSFLSAGEKFVYIVYRKIGIHNVLYAL